jgi:hypothetical protein
VLPALPESKNEADEPLVLPGSGDEIETGWTPGPDLDLRPGLLLRLESIGGDFDPNSGWGLTLSGHPDWG